MQIRTAIIGLVCIVVLTVVCLFWKISIATRPMPNPTTTGYFRNSAKEGTDLQSQETCSDHSWKFKELENFYRSISVVYDFSTISPEQLEHDMNILLNDINQNLISGLILINNYCKNEETSAAAVRVASARDDISVVLIEASERVSTGRARIAAMAKSRAPYILFLSAGSVPDSNQFLENMLYVVKESPSHVVSPSRKLIYNSFHYISWSLKVKTGVVSGAVNSIRAATLPLLDNSAFLIRRDLYKAVGGYDSFFFKYDSSDSIAFSLAIWLCGGSIVRTNCARVQTSENGGEDAQSVNYLQHAKYIQEVFGGALSDHFTYPGIEFYTSSIYDRRAIQIRRSLFASQGCMTMEWYAHKFPIFLPAKTGTARLYNPKYTPHLPPYEKKPSQIGRWFVLFVGHCVNVAEDSVLGLSWCPTTLSQHYIFTWQPNGQIKVQKDKCVTLRAADLLLVVTDCKEGTDHTQLFSYSKTTRQIQAKHNGHCITHVNGPEGRQILQPMECSADSPFNKFVINGEY